MAVFRFRLARLLRLRERAERSAAQRLGMARSELEESRRCLAALQGQRDLLLARRDDLQRGRLLPALLIENRWQLVAAGKGIHREDERRQALEAHAENLREALIERMREKRLLEKLRERRLAEHVEAENRRERKEQEERPFARHGMAVAMESPSESRGHRNEIGRSIQRL
jgi:flagellar FliJ protein